MELNINNHLKKLHNSFATKQKQLRQLKSKFLVVVYLNIVKGNNLHFTERNNKGT